MTLLAGLLLAVSACVSTPPLPSAAPGSDPAAAGLFRQNDSWSPEDADEASALVDEEFSAEPADGETRADNRLLQALLDGPESEGETVPVPVTFDFPVVENDKVRYFVEYFSVRERAVFTRWLERSSRYVPRIQEIFEEAGLPRDLAYLAMVESGFNPHAYSWAHAAGPWQFIESTGRLHGLKNTWWYDERRDYEKSTRAAAAFLKSLKARFGDWYLAVAAYNAGPGKISRAMQKYRSEDFWELTRGSYLAAETKSYVPKLLAALIIVKQPEKYGFTDIAWQEPLAAETVLIPTTTDLEVVARLCGTDYESIKLLNPELKRWATPPELRNYPLRIPAGTLEAFTAAYARLPVAERASYAHYRVQAGDTLGAIARRYDIRVDEIVSLNRISNPRALKIGADLILPLRKGTGGGKAVAELKDDYNRTRRQTHTVRNGDTLWEIARRYNVTTKELRVWNKLGWSDVIRPGQVLVVSRRPAAAPAKTAQAAPAQGRPLLYTVQPGDTLWGIGRRYAVPPDRIMAWNQLTADSVLRPGDTLTLHAHDG